MKVIVAGSRSIKSIDTVTNAIISSGYKITTLVSGCALGVDSLAIQYGKMNHIQIKEFPAD